MQVAKVSYSITKVLRQYENEVLTCEVVSTEDEEDGMKMLSHAKATCLANLTATGAPVGTSVTRKTPTPAPVRAAPSPQQGPKQYTPEDNAKSLEWAEAQPFGYEIPYNLTTAEVKTALKAAKFRFIGKKAGNIRDAWYGGVEIRSPEWLSQYMIKGSPQPQAFDGYPDYDASEPNI